jgi:hypothetical protein
MRPFRVFGGSSMEVVRRRLQPRPRSVHHFYKFLPEELSKIYELIRIVLSVLCDVQ